MKKKRKLGRKLLSFLLTLAMLVGLMPGMSLTVYAIYDPNGLEHFIPFLDNGGNVAFYDVSIRVNDDNQNTQRTVRLLFSTLTKEQITAKPGWSNISSTDTNYNCYLPGDTNTPPNGSQITVSDVGIDTQDITYTTPSTSGVNALNFEFSTVTLDPNTSYYVYFILRSAKQPYYTVYRMIGDSLGTLKPMKINYNKQKTDGTYDTTIVNTHYVSGQYLDVSKLGTVPTGYHINTSSSTSSGNWNGTSEINIYYDMDVDISLTPDSTTLNVGGTQALTAAIVPSNAADKTVKWSVSETNADAVELYSNEACTTKVGTGATETLTVYAKGISVGSATVKVTSNADATKSATCTVTVNKASVTAPAIASKTYNGKKQTADVQTNTLYTVTTNEGGTNVGTYDVVLTLADSTNYKWTDSEEATKTLTFRITKASAPTVTVPTPEAVTYDPAKTLADISLTDGWTWVTETIVPTVGNAGYDAELTVDDANYDYTGVKGYDSENHKVVRTVTLTVNKADSTAATVTPVNRTYDGMESSLATVTGDAVGGVMNYALGENGTTAPTEGWTTSIPTATDAGTYYVWYKVAGDENHTDTDPVCITVDIDTKTDVTAEQKQGETLTYDGTAKTPTLEIKDGETEIGTYTVKYVGVEPTVYEESETAPTDAGNYKAVITLKGNYSGTKEVPFKIDKKAAAVLTDNQKPTKNNALEYTSNPIELVTAPAGTIPAGYTIEYSIDNGTTWTTAIPTATVAGDYTVKVRYKGDENHEDFTGDDINVNIAKAVPNFTVPEDINASYGQKLSDVSLPTGWSWKDGTTSVGEIGTKTFKATFTPDDTTNYKTIEMDVAVKVNKAVPIIETKPKKVDNLIYTGLPCELVTAGSGVTGGTLKYVLGADADATPTDEVAWSTEIPTATNAGTYYVWYKVVGDENHNDTNPVCIRVTIEERKDTDTSIKTEVEADKDAPAIKVDNFDETLAEKLLTDEEKESYEAGTPVLVYLDEKVVDKNDVPAEDMTAIEKTIADEGYTYGVCLDLSLWKKLGNNAAVQIHDTNGNPIKITVSIPDTLKNAPEGYIRTYQIVRVHDGVATVLAEGTGDTLALSSDKFSSYFIVYKDAKKAADDKKQDTPATADTPKQDTPATVDTPKAEVTNTDKANKDNKISTGDKMHIGIIIMLMIDSAMAALYLTLRKKKIK